MIYINFDLETTGLHCDRGAILSVGAVAHDSTRWALLGEFSRNIRIPPGRIWEPSYKAWWDAQPKETLEANTVNPSDPWWVMESMLNWFEHLQHSVNGEDRRIAFVANPIAFDLPMLRSYMVEFAAKRWEAFTQENKAGLGGLDLPTLAMAVLNRPYPDSRRSKWPKGWTPDNLPLTHIAIDDARLQAHAFVEMMTHLAEIHETVNNSNPGLRAAIER